jgi:hypothetical protein
VAVEKPTRQKMAGKTLRSEALQTTFSVRLDVFHLPFFDLFEELEFFSSHEILRHLAEVE